jgi:hypothetical protein
LPSLGLGLCGDYYARPFSSPLLGSLYRFRHSSLRPRRLSSSLFILFPILSLISNISTFLYLVVPPLIFTLFITAMPCSDYVASMSSYYYLCGYVALFIFFSSSISSDSPASLPFILWMERYPAMVNMPLSPAACALNVLLPTLSVFCERLYCHCRSTCHVHRVLAVLWRRLSSDLLLVQHISPLISWLSLDTRLQSVSLLAFLFGHCFDLL